MVILTPALTSQKVERPSSISFSWLMILDDNDSIKRLNDITMQNVKNEKLKLLYVAAQVADIDLKINAAVVETMKIYRRVLNSSYLLSAVPTAASSSQAAGAIAVCKAVLQCFGLPTINAEMIYQILKSNVWDDLGHNISLLFAEAIASVGLMGTLVLYGGPVFLAAGAVNIPLVVPATMRLLLMIASDLILILVRAFKETTLTCVGQPLKRDVRKAATYYRTFSPEVHKEIFALIPRTNVAKSFRHNDVRQGLEKIVHRFKDEVTRDIVSLGLSRTESGKSSMSSDQARMDIAEIEQMLKAAKAELEKRKTEEKDVAVRETAELPERTRTEPE